MSQPHAKINALERLSQTTRNLSKSLHLGLNVAVDSEDPDEPLLSINSGLLVAWVDEGGRYVVDETVDVSDQSVGIFGAYEPRSLGSADPVLVTSDDIDAAVALVTCAVQHAAADWASSESEDRSYYENMAYGKDRREP